MFVTRKLRNEFELRSVTVEKRRSILFFVLRIISRFSLSSIILFIDSRKNFTFLLRALITYLMPYIKLYINNLSMKSFLRRRYFRFNRFFILLNIMNISQIFVCNSNLLPLIFILGIRDLFFLFFFSFFSFFLFDFLPL